MTHWQHRPETQWQQFEFNQPYAKGLQRLREEVLAKTDFDPATLWQWGTMQAMALIEVLKDCEARFGTEGQQVVFGALRKIGLDIGRQILAGTRIPEGLSEAEFLSFYATVLNRIAYASLEAPRIENQQQVSFHILWCPHQDHYQAFDCRVQRYFVQGMLDAAKEFWGNLGFQLRFDYTIPAGEETCHFTFWQAAEGEQSQWAEYTALLERKALARGQTQTQIQTQPQAPPTPNPDR